MFEVISFQDITKEMQTIKNGIHTAKLCLVVHWCSTMGFLAGYYIAMH